jgi:hypothetical protein
MRWREFIVGLLLVGLATTQTHEALARDLTKIPRIGYLGTNIGPLSLPPIEGFREGLRQLGYIEGQNIIVEYRWGRGQAEEVATGQAVELVRLDLDLIVAASTIYLPPLRQAGATMPIVFCFSNDPVAEGLVASLARPGGRLEGAALAQAQPSARDCCRQPTKATPTRPERRLRSSQRKRARDRRRFEWVLAEAQPLSSGPPLPAQEGSIVFALQKSGPKAS